MKDFGSELRSVTKFIVAFLFGAFMLLQGLLLIQSYRYHQLKDEVKSKQETIQQQRGMIDSQQMRIEQLKKRVERLEKNAGMRIKWMTRAIVSETTRPNEMRVIAEIIRNRVETRWRGHHTYKRVILDPYQFSAFNPGRGTASIYRNMTMENTPYPDLWREARGIAEIVLYADRSDLITDRDVTHFHHNQVKPRWSHELRTVNVGGERLRAYANPQIQTSK